MSKEKEISKRKQQIPLPNTAKQDCSSSPDFLVLTTSVTLFLGNVAFDTLNASRNRIQHEVRKHFLTEQFFA